METPILRADDLGTLRGDGVFETTHVRGGEPWLLDEHLDRMARSAARLDLRLPSRDELAALAATACGAWDDATEGALRLVCTRGPEDGDGSPTVFATLSEVGDRQRQARRDGVAVGTATLAVDIDARSEAPWLLGGAKTLSYAVNMASLRWAASTGTDDVLWVSADGYALEAPTSTLVWLAGDELCTVPPATTGILPGITTRWLLDHAAELGWQSTERLVRPAELRTVDGVWLASSVRGLAEVRTLDGVALRTSTETGRMMKLLGFPT